MLAAATFVVMVLASDVVHLTCMPDVTLAMSSGDSRILDVTVDG